MFVNTKAIVLGSLKLKDNALLLRLYTQEHGRCDYVMYGAQSKRNGKKTSFLQPLSLVEVTADHRANRDLQVVRDIRLYHSGTDIQLNPYKNVEAVFLSEVLSSVLIGQQADEILFTFLEYSINRLEIATRGIANFHLVFLTHLPMFLGFYPNLERSTDTPVFDMRLASFVRLHETHEQCLTVSESAFVTRLMRINYDNMPFFRLNRNERHLTLRKIIDYYRLHIHGMKEPKSLDVLTEVFD